MQHPTRQAGVTLVEITVALAIVAIVIGLAVPSLASAIERRRLEGAAAQLETDLQLARSEAVARGESVRVDFANGEHGSCYVMHGGPAGGCRCEGQGTPVCDAGLQPLRSMHFEPSSPVQLRSNSASVLFDAVRGTITPTATVRVVGESGTLRVVINVMGRVRGCTPDGAVPGWPAC